MLFRTFGVQFLIRPSPACVEGLYSCSPPRANADLSFRFMLEYRALFSRLYHCSCSSDSSSGRLHMVRFPVWYSVRGLNPYRHNERDMDIIGPTLLHMRIFSCILWCCVSKLQHEEQAEETFLWKKGVEPNLHGLRSEPPMGNLLERRWRYSVLRSLLGELGVYRSGFLVLGTTGEHI